MSSRRPRGVIYAVDLADVDWIEDATEPRPRGSLQSGTPGEQRGGDERADEDGGELSRKRPAVLYGEPHPVAEPRGSDEGAQVDEEPPEEAGAWHAANLTPTPNRPASSPSTSEPRETPRAREAAASRTDLARLREPAIHAGLRGGTRAGRECSKGVCSTRQQQSPGGAETPRGADKEG